MGSNPALGSANFYYENMQIEGRNPVYEALKSDSKITVLYIQSKAVKTNKIRQIISLAQKKGIRIKKVGANKLKKMSKTKNHQGVIAKMLRRYDTLEDIIKKLETTNETPFFVILQETLYQQNLGAIIRSAECAGCNGVIISNKIRLTSEAVRASMGATEHIPIIKNNIFNAIKILQEYDIKIVGLEASGKKNLYETNLKGPLAFFIGGEHSGITKSFIKKCDIVINIPLFGKINSLNMSNAAAIAFYEKVRQELVNKLN